MEDEEIKEEPVSPYYGLNMKNLRKALFLFFFGGKDAEAANDFENENYKYIIPMNNSWVNPLVDPDAKGTYVQYLIEKDEELTMDDYTYDKELMPNGEEVPVGYSRQKKVATVLLRFLGKEAESWCKTFNHMNKRQGLSLIWSQVCNAGVLPYTAPTFTRQVNYFGKSTSIAFDVRIFLRYDEVMRLNWEPLEGIDITLDGKIENYDDIS